MMMRKFSADGDVERAREFVLNSRGVERTRELAEKHVAMAIDCAQRLHQPDPIAALCNVARSVVARTK
jgi:geranylgeranyl pyrophosphate synthase